jgi:hypothetical protein
MFCCFVCIQCGHYGDPDTSRWKKTDGRDRRCHQCIIESGDASEEEMKLWRNIPRFQKAPDSLPRGEPVM